MDKLGNSESIIIWQIIRVWCNNGPIQPGISSLTSSHLSLAGSELRQITETCEVAPVTPKLIRPIFLRLLVAFAVVWSSALVFIKETWAERQAQRSDRVVFLIGNLTDESLINLTANLPSCDDRAILLLDSPQSSSENQRFLKTYQPDRIIPVGSFPKGLTEIEQRLGVRVASIIPYDGGPSFALWKGFNPPADRVVVCTAEPRQQLLQAACLAGAWGIPLFVLTGQPGEESLFRQQLSDWKTQKVYAVGDSVILCHDLKHVKIIRLPDTDATARAHRLHLKQQGPIENLVVANPFEGQKGRNSMSALAPWIAVQHQAALLLTNEKGDDAGQIVRESLPSADFRRAESMILVGDSKAIPMEWRPNPAGGKDQVIEMEPMTPTGAEPFTLSTGRMFADDPALVALLLARQKLLASRSSDLKALVVSNPSGGLPLLETFSRNTAKELTNTGYQMTALFNKDVNPDHIRKLMPDQNVFLWEGHYATLTKEYKMQEWTEPMKPSLVFLQSCLALSDGKAQSFLQRGAVAVVGTSTRTYSASGGACSLAFFNALMYDQETLGGSLRQAKNFLLTYSLLKEKRLGKSAKLTGANIRSSWAFSLWGDPTLRFPTPILPEGALPAVRQVALGRTITITLPEAKYRKAISNQYQAEMLPNGRLAGLITPDEDEENVKHLVPFIFAEVHLPNAPAEKSPILRSRLPESRWVFNWDARRRCGYLLFMPRAKDHDELRFNVDWHDEAIAESKSRPSNGVVVHD